MSGDTLRRPEPDGMLAPSRDAHRVQFYDGEELLASSVCDFIAPALRASEGVAIIATSQHWIAFVAALRARGVETEPAQRRGQLLVLDANEALAIICSGPRVDTGAFRRFIGGALQSICASSPSRSGRAYGEMVNLLWQRKQPDTALRIEALWTDLLRAYSVELLCAYEMRSIVRASDRVGFHAVLDAHSGVDLVEEPAHGGADLTVARLQQRTMALEREVQIRTDAETRLANLNRTLVEEVRRRKDADRRKDEFLAMLGHELRNPLAPIVAALELMRVRNVPGGERERDVIQRQTQQLMRLVEDLVDISRITRGAIELRSEMVDLVPVVEIAVETVSPLVEERGHTLSLQLPGEGLFVRGDRGRLAQALTNVITNAAKYTDRGGRIEITGALEGRSVIVSVQDNGIGIPDELLAEIFDPFVQVPQSIDRSRGGLGLGLAVVRHFVQLHGGTVSVHSHPGEGSRFDICLPASEPAFDSIESNDNRGERCSRPATTSRRVLVVDDNVDAADLLAEILRDRGHDVRIAYDAVQALALSTEADFDFALMDLGLPVMNGYDLLQRMRASLGAKAPAFIAVSGYGQPSDRERTRAAGFVHHFTKPFDHEALVARIEAT